MAKDKQGKLDRSIRNLQVPSKQIKDNILHKCSAVTNFGKWWSCCEIRNHKRCWTPCQSHKQKRWKSSAGPLRSDQSSKQDITEYLHLLAIEKSGSFVKSAETCKLPKSAVPVNEASKLETPAKSQTVLPSINVLTRLKSRVKQLTGKGISEEQN